MDVNKNPEEAYTQKSLETSKLPLDIEEIDEEKLIDLMVRRC
jgi:hypothetical protein